MEISQIKRQLSISEVLSRYGLKVGANGKMCCPFHEDSTASFQVYAKTNTAYCFSANCPTGGKSMDVIDFIMYKEQITKHEAITKAAAWVGNTAIIQPKSIQSKVTNPLVRVAILTKMFSYFKAAVYNSPPAKEYFKSRNLDYNKLDIGYNSGQFHHGTRKDEALIQSCLEVGLLSDEGLKSKTGDKAYKVFGKYGIVFPLKNKENQIVSLYFRSTIPNTEHKHFYLKDRQGLYPSYPKPETKILILTEAIIDATTLLCHVELVETSILACYGVNGFTEEHREAVSQLNDLTEIIFFFDGDQAGKNGQEAIAKQINDMCKQLTLSFVDTPENEDINSLAVSHEGGIKNESFLSQTSAAAKELFSHLLENRKPFSPLTPEGGTSTAQQTIQKQIFSFSSEPIENESFTPPSEGLGRLNTSNPEKLEYQNNWLTASV
jgi:DNA primase catalytic core